MDLWSDKLCAIRGPDFLTSLVLGVTRSDFFRICNILGLIFLDFFEIPRQLSEIWLNSDFRS